MYSLKFKWMLGWFSKRIHQMELHDWGQLSVPFGPTRRCQLQGPLARSCGRSQPDPHAAELPMRQEEPPWEGASVRHTVQRSAPLPLPSGAHRAAFPPVHTAPQPRTVGVWGQVLSLVLVFPSRWAFQKLGLQEWKLTKQRVVIGKSSHHLQHFPRLFRTTDKAGTHTHTLKGLSVWSISNISFVVVCTS